MGKLKPTNSSSYPPVWSSEKATNDSRCLLLRFGFGLCFCFHLEFRFCFRFGLSNLVEATHIEASATCRHRVAPWLFPQQPPRLRVFAALQQLSRRSGTRPKAETAVEARLLLTSTPDKIRSSESKQNMNMMFSEGYLLLGFIYSSFSALRLNCTLLKTLSGDFKLWVCPHHISMAPGKRNHPRCQWVFQLSGWMRSTFSNFRSCLRNWIAASD